MLKNNHYILSHGEKRGVKYTLTEYGLIHRLYVSQIFLSEENTTRGGLVRFTDNIFAILKNRGEHLHYSRHGTTHL